MLGKFLVNKFYLAANTTIHLINLIKKHIEEAMEELEQTEKPQALVKMTLSELSTELESFPTKIKNLLAKLDKAGEFFDNLTRELCKQD